MYLLITNELNEDNFSFFMMFMSLFEKARKDVDKN